MSEFVSLLRRNVPKNALFYKNIIRNDKLRKLTYEDFFKIFFFNFVFFYSSSSSSFSNGPQRTIFFTSTIGNILILYLRIFFQFFFSIFFFQMSQMNMVAALRRFIRPCYSSSSFFSNDPQRTFFTL